MSVNVLRPEITHCISCICWSLIVELHVLTRVKSVQRNVTYWNLHKNYGVPLVYQNVLINADQLNYDIHTFANGRIFTSFSSCLSISSWRICMRERTRGRESRLKQYGMCVVNRIARYSLQHSMIMSSRWLQLWLLGNDGQPMQLPTQGSRKTHGKSSNQIGWLELLSLHRQKSVL